MLLGSYLAVLNEKRRVAIPKKFANELGAKPVLAKWYEDCLIIVSSGFWNELLDWLIGGKRVASLGVRDIERFILGSAFELEPDDQGRIVIPEVLVKYANLSKDIVFVGVGNRVEVWEARRWEEKAAELSKTTREYIENISVKK